MDKIKIEFSRDQYEKLVETIFLGSWVVNSIRLDDLDEDVEEIREIILSKYKEAGLEDKIIHQEELGVYDLDIDFESSLLDQYVEEYDEFSFWDKLVEKLTEKEMIDKYGASVTSGELSEEMMKTQLELEERIGRELEEKGVTNLTLNRE
ncbi:hypothetical protein MUN89_16850 [Halobacillus salinarum]|uniref:Uncharacterized protein n=1 Tax=Halobacillus salinarum TaxID=2932257 RepID=A0ABY4EHU3_9BACI|nr:hypothetical protein [Halobacillus salinarum]UOQ43565.1 hypothetical protein MUN89_16850 [Halobacillus salinarum]